MSKTVPYRDGGDLAGLVDAADNADVVGYLAETRPSCHSDVGDLLLRTAERCGDWLAYSPSFGQCRYVALIANRRIFALGIGQRSACFRLPPESRVIALQTGGVEATEIGGDWVRFELFRPDWPSPDLPFWTLRAYAAARERPPARA